MLKKLGRLHIIVIVEQESVISRPHFPHDDRIPRRLHDLSSNSMRAKHLHQQVCAGLHADPLSRDALLGTEPGQLGQ